MHIRRESKTDVKRTIHPASVALTKQTGMMFNSQGPVQQKEHGLASEMRVNSL